MPWRGGGKWEITRAGHEVERVGRIMGKSLYCHFQRKKTCEAR